MPRSNRPRRGGRPDRRRPGEEPLDESRALGGGRLEQYAGERYAVRAITGAGATKTYRCPGCDQEIGPGTPHVVAWPLDPVSGAGDEGGDRRHWHTPCWAARGRRSPRR